MERLLVTGARGFIGSQCLPLLSPLGLEVHCVSRAPAAGAPSASDWHAVDLLDSEAVSALIARLRPTHLLHLAWVTTPGSYWTSEANLAWLAASERLLEAFARAGGRRAVLAGTCAEYDWTCGTCVEGETPICPASLYGSSKDRLRRKLEALAKQAGFAAAWARIFFVYGPGEPEARLFSSIIRRLARRESAPCSEGSQRRDFIHVEDVAGALVALLSGGTEGPVNLGTGRATSVRDAALCVGRAMGRPELIDFGARTGPPEAPLVVADASRLLREVGFSPRFDLESGIAGLVEWWQSRAGPEARA